MKYLVYAVCALALLSGCAQTKKMAPKEGRESVQSRLTNPVIQKSNSGVELTEAQTISDWHSANYNTQNKIPHAQIDGFSTKIWKENVGKGISSSTLHLPDPIVHQDVIYTLDGKLRLTETDKNGHAIWDIELRTEKNIPAVASIGLTYDNGIIYVVAGDGIVYAVQPHGEIIWQHDTESILRSSPVVKNGHLYVLSANNELIVLNTKDGSLAWNYKNLETSTNLMGMGKPAISQGIAVVPFSSGEVIAFDDKTGNPLWSNTLSAYRTFNQVADLTHILADPVIEGNVVYLIGNAHKMGAFKLKTGEPIFVQPIGGQTTPVTVGNTLFMVTNKDSLIAINKYNGNLIWEKDLYSQTQKQVAWHTPIPVNNQILITSSEGDFIAFDMIDGTETKKIKTDKLFVSPIAYNNGLLFYTNEANLIMYR